MWKIIGYGPASVVLPFIPDWILVQDDQSKTLCILKSDPRIQSGEPIPEGSSPHTGAYPFADGLWVCVESESKLRTFDASSEREFRSRRAQELAQEALNLRGDPLLTLRMVRAAGSLQGVDVPGLTRRLQHSKSDPDESLVSVMERLRRQSK